MATNDIAASQLHQTPADPEVESPESQDATGDAAANPSRWDGVPEVLRSALEKRGFGELTKIQRAVVESNNAGRNLRLSSKTGSGKTVALGIAIVSALADERARELRALIIVPTRELAHQVQKELRWLYADMPGARTEVVTGGTDIRQEKRRLRESPTVVVGTPGRLLDHVQSGVLNLSTVREVVLDEADQMLDLGFKDELDALLAQLPEQRRSHLVSATFPRAVERLAHAFQDNPLELEGTALGEPNQDIEHVAHLVMDRDRYPALVNILLDNLGERCLVFVQRRIDASGVAEALQKDGFSALPLSGDLPQAQRSRTLSAFKSGSIDILVATDVAARGLHVDDISMVVHDDMPRESDTYTHRSGRTGRAGQKGRSIMLVVPQARRRVEMLLQRAGVTFSWSPLPDPKKIRRKMMKAGRRRFHEQLAELADNPLQLDAASKEYAERLLAEHDPSHVVAVLLDLASPKLPTEPRQVVEPDLQWERQRPRGYRVASNQDGDRRRGFRGGGHEGDRRYKPKGFRGAPAQDGRGPKRYSKGRKPFSGSGGQGQGK